MVRKLRKAVFPVGGLGTRFLPATKAMPKEMLPVVDKPLIQYAVEEALEAGIDQMIFVTGRGKHAIEDHFDIAYELEATMSSRGKSLTDPPGHPAHARATSPIAASRSRWVSAMRCGARATSSATSRSRCCSPDDFMVGKPGCLKQMVEAYEKVGGNMICAQEVAHDQTDKYGIITPGARDGRLTEVKGLVEKPKPDAAPSNLAIVGRYILQPEVMRILERQEKGAGGEIQLTDAMARMIGEQPFHGVTFDGVRHDCGDKAGFIQANIALALERDDVGPAVKAFIDRL